MTGNKMYKENTFTSIYNSHYTTIHVQDTTVMYRAAFR